MESHNDMFNMHSLGTSNTMAMIHYSRLVRMTNQEHRHTSVGKGVKPEESALWEGKRAEPPWENSPYSWEDKHTPAF